MDNSIQPSEHTKHSDRRASQSFQNRNDVRLALVKTFVIKNTSFFSANVVDRWGRWGFVVQRYRRFLTWSCIVKVEFCLSCTVQGIWPWFVKVKIMFVVIVKANFACRAPCKAYGRDPWKLKKMLVVHRESRILLVVHRAMFMAAIRES